jgi:hypothetical protein
MYLETKCKGHQRKTKDDALMCVEEKMFKTLKIKRGEQSNKILVLRTIQNFGKIKKKNSSFVLIIEINFVVKNGY